VPCPDPRWRTRSWTPAGTARRRPRPTLAAGADTLYGGGGDYFYGEGGADLLAGGGGNDDLNAVDGAGHPAGTDTVKGGRGGDEIDARDGHNDLIDCGPGIDPVRLDKGLDTVVNRERPEIPIER
jgi:Ca2+-binding RTX toxin-like protein